MASDPNNAYRLYTLTRQCQDELERCYLKAETHFRRLLPRPIMKFNLRGGVAGKAFYHSNEIRFNPILLEENPEDMIGNTVAHEVAHLVAHLVYGHQSHGHGKDWAFVLGTVLGATVSQYHCYDTRRAQRLSYAYRCNCKDRVFHLSTQKHHRIIAGHTYSCSSCRARLRFSHKENLKTGCVDHTMQLGGLILAVDPALQDMSGLGARFGRILHDERPTWIGLVYEVVGNALRRWISGTGSCVYTVHFNDELPRGVTIRATHGIAITTGHDHQLQRLFDALRKNGLAVRYLKPTE
jgi:SprT protein